MRCHCVLHSYQHAGGHRRKGQHTANVHKWRQCVLPAVWLMLTRTETGVYWHTTEGTPWLQIWLCYFVIDLLVCQDILTNLLARIEDLNIAFLWLNYVNLSICYYVRWLAHGLRFPHRPRPSRSLMVSNKPPLFNVRHHLLSRTIWSSWGSQISDLKKMSIMIIIMIIQFTL